MGVYNEYGNGFKVVGINSVEIDLGFIGVNTSREEAIRHGICFFTRAEVKCGLRDLIAAYNFPGSPIGITTLGMNWSRATSTITCLSSGGAQWRGLSNPDGVGVLWRTEEMAGLIKYLMETIDT